MWLLKDAPSNARRSLSQARDPSKARVNSRWKTVRYGRGCRWRCRWEQILPSGKRKQATKMFHERTDAESFAAAMEDDVRRGRYRDPHDGQRLFLQVAHAWLDSKVDLKASTRGRYMLELQQYVLPRWGGTPISAVTADGLQEWVRQLQQGDYPAPASRRKPEHGLSPRSIRSIVKIVASGVLDYAHSEGWISENPVKRVHIPRPHKRELTILTPRQVQDLAEAASAVGRWSDGLLIRFQAYVGTRIDEALALRVGDIDWVHSMARIERTWTSDGHDHMILGSPKNGKSRTVAIPRFLLKDLAKQCNDKADGDYVFTSPQGRPINVRNWRNRVWYRALLEAGIDRSVVTIHSLRHTYASMAIAAGADVKTLQRQLGHSSAAITLDVYAQLFPSRLSDVANAISRMAGYKTDTNAAQIRARS